MTDGTVVAGIDEVGRGALAGPVMVGIVAMTRMCAEPPEGLADSKLLTAHQREELVAPSRQWATAWATGIGTSQEIDELQDWSYLDSRLIHRNEKKCEACMALRTRFGTCHDETPVAHMSQ